MRPTVHRTAGLAAALTLVAAACVAQSGATAESPSATVRVVERDFRISAPKRIARGEIRLVVVNKGPDDHELIIVRRAGRGLPLRADGLTVDEDALAPVRRYALEPAPPGTVHEATVRLSPGRYTLLCNMSGHFMAGMYTVLEVR